ncbi:MAG TPA: hypothetical protein VI039_04350 [Solirubrobacterales bacterium]
MRLRSKVLGLAALLAIVAVTAFAPATATSQGGFHSCGDMPRYYTQNIEAKGVECPKAKRVVLRYARITIDNLQHDWSVTVLGFKCDLVKKDYYGDSHRCTDNGRVIRWRRGTH